MCFSRNLTLIDKPGDATNHAEILSWSGDSYMAVPLKAYVAAFHTGSWRARRISTTQTKAALVGTPWLVKNDSNV